MIKKTKPNVLDVMSHIKIFPHCDPRILHAPGECEVCDKHSDWQALRQIWGITFTGYEPEGKELPDPATHARGFENLNAWGGNKAHPRTKYYVDETTCALVGCTATGLHTHEISGPVCSA